MWVCVLICDQWFDQWLIDLMLSDQVRVIRLLAFINAASNFLSSVPLLPLPLPLPLSFSSFSLYLPLLHVKLYNEKRQDLVEQQLHLNIGLQKIRGTVDQVEELQASQWARALASYTSCEVIFSASCWLYIICFSFWWKFVLMGRHDKSYLYRGNFTLPLDPSKLEFSLILYDE